MDVGATLAISSSALQAQRLRMDVILFALATSSVRFCTGRWPK